MSQLYKKYQNHVLFNFLFSFFYSIFILEGLEFRKIIHATVMYNVENVATYDYD